MPPTSSTPECRRLRALEQQLCAAACASIMPGQPAAAVEHPAFEVMRVEQVAISHGRLDCSYIHRI